MKVLVIDRDRLASEMMKTKIEAMGHSVIEEAVKNNAMEIMANQQIDAVFFDPAPLANARPVILGIRRTLKEYAYICMVSHNISEEEAFSMGANCLLKKPIDPEDLKEKVANSSRLVDLVKKIGDESEDFPSAGGVISKSAFNQLFLAAIDRADRYGEISNVVFVSLSNYEDIKAVDGPYAAEYAVSKMVQYLVKLRRQSDIIAQTAVNEYAFLLQRPLSKDEPMEAAVRFASALSEYSAIVSGGSSDIEITVELLDVPVSSLCYSHKVVHASPKAQSAES